MNREAHHQRLLPSVPVDGEEKMNHQIRFKAARLENEKRGPSKCMQPFPIIPLITCNIVAGDFCHAASD